MTRASLDSSSCCRSSHVKIQIQTVLKNNKKENAKEGTCMKKEEGQDTECERSEKRSRDVRSEGEPSA